MPADSPDNGGRRRVGIQRMRGRTLRGNSDGGANMGDRSDRAAEGGESVGSGGGPEA